MYTKHINYLNILISLFYCFLELESKLREADGSTVDSKESQAGISKMKEYEKTIKNLKQEKEEALRVIYYFYLFI